MKAHFIFYVADQGRSTNFYSTTFDEGPTLNVPGMTEFSFGSEIVLGLMPEDGIVRLLGSSISHPSLARGIPRSEFYLIVEDAAAFHNRAVAAGALELSPFTPRDWGYSVAYSQDPDGHILAFASPSHA